MIMEWYIKVLKQYNDFKTRARRKEYWMFFLFSIIISGTLGIIDNYFELYYGASYEFIEGSFVEKDSTNGLLSGIYSLFILVPSLAVAVRRLHDVGKSGWMLLVALIPLIGAIWLLILFCKDSQIEENKWGANPK